MKKILAIICFLSILSLQAQAGLIGDFYNNERYGCSLSGSGWKGDVAQQKKLVVFRSDDGISETGLDVQPLAKYSAQKAIDVAKARVEGYDSWMYIGGRQMEGGELWSANAADGFLVMYSKNVFSRAGGAIKILVVEKYFVKGGYVYIVSMITSSQAWASSKDNLMRVANSLKIS